MTRDQLLQMSADRSSDWDMIVVGGGATGLGTAVEAASRGYHTLLLDQDDFAQGTSSRSTKLIHGGVRYLKQGNISLVLEALHERGLLVGNAPHLVQNLSFVVPLYDWWEGPFYGIGLKLYDMMAGRLGLGPSHILSREETMVHIPNIEPHGLRGGVIYHDAQFDDARLAIHLARTVEDLGGTVINYIRVNGFIKSGGLITGVITEDRETGKEYRFSTKVVINATGVFSDNVRCMDDPDSVPVITPSRGVHLVLDRSFLPGDSAIMIPHTEDGRVLFAIPWHGRVVIGTTDTPVSDVVSEPLPAPEEIDFLLHHAARYLERHPTRDDILSAFAGLRPLAAGSDKSVTASVSREHTIMIGSSGLVTITGGKWTTYRRMGEDTVNQAAVVAGLEDRPSVTSGLRIHGRRENGSEGMPWDLYGADAPELRALVDENREWGELLHPKLPYRACEVVWGVRKEWARRLEDILARRTRSLLLDARASMTIAPKVAEIMAKELGRDEVWQKEQVNEFCKLAQNYLPT